MDHHGLDRVLVRVGAVLEPIARESLQQDLAAVEPLGGHAFEAEVVVHEGDAAEDAALQVIDRHQPDVPVGLIRLVDRLTRVECPLHGDAILHPVVCAAERQLLAVECSEPWEGREYTGRARA